MIDNRSKEKITPLVQKFAEFGVEQFNGWYLQLVATFLALRSFASERTLHSKVCRTLRTVEINELFHGFVKMF